MPGMMETVLDVGLNDESVHGLARHGGERFALDSYRRLIQMFGSTVLGIEPKVFATALAELKDSRSRVDDAGLDVDDLRELVSTYQALVLEYAGRLPPGSTRAARPRRTRGLRLLAHATGRLLPAPRAHPRGTSARL